MTNQESKIKEGLSPAIRWALSLMMLYFLTADLLAQQGVKQNKEGLETFGGQQVMTLNSIDEVDDDNDRITFYADEFRVLDPDDGVELFDARSLKTRDQIIPEGAKLIFPGSIPTPVPGPSSFEFFNYNGNLVIRDGENINDVIFEYEQDGAFGRGELDLYNHVILNGTIVDHSGANNINHPATLRFFNDVNALSDVLNQWRVVGYKDLSFSKGIAEAEDERLRLTQDFDGKGLEVMATSRSNPHTDFSFFLNFRPQGFRDWQLSNAKTNNLKFNYLDEKNHQWLTSFEISKDGVTVEGPVGDTSLKIKPFTVFDDGANLYNENFLNIGAGNGTGGKGKAHIIISPLALEPVLIRYNPINVPTAKTWNDPIKNGFALAVEKGVLSERLEIANRSSWTTDVDYNVSERIVVRPPGPGAEIFSATNNLDLGSNGDRVYIRLPGEERVPVLIRYNPELGGYDSPDWNDQVKGTEESGGFALVVERGVLTEDLAIASSGQWADYVFQEDYELMPLEELEKFVTVEQHLPGVVSEAKIKEDGFYQMHDAMVGQLKNLEEQVLHNIAQEKMIKGQATKIKDQSQKLDQLEKLVEQLSEQVQKLQGHLEK